MQARWVLLYSLILLGPNAQAGTGVLRVDYVHSGNATQETFGLSQVRLEPTEWSGKTAIDSKAEVLGDYLFEVRDAKSQALLYQSGFSSIFSEWAHTKEASQVNRAFEESLRFPLLAGTVTVIVKKRTVNAGFQEVWRLQIDSKDAGIDRSSGAQAELMSLMKNGPSPSKLDLVMVAEGYTALERDKFMRDAQRMMAAIFAQAPFAQHRQDFNVWVVFQPSADSGISDPKGRIYERSALGLSFDAFGMDRYMLVRHVHWLRELASLAPYDAIVVLANSKSYGGGGIYNQFAVVAVDHPAAAYVLVHEFGHSLVGLADEYDQGEVAYQDAQQKSEPWNPNVTMVTNPLKWKGITSSYVEGAMYHAKGYYRPEPSCVMRSGDASSFCSVCKAAIENVIAQYTAK